MYTIESWVLIYDVKVYGSSESHANRANRFLIYVFFLSFLKYVVMSKQLEKSALMSVLISDVNDTLLPPQQGVLVCRTNSIAVLNMFYIQSTIILALTKHF